MTASNSGQNLFLNLSIHVVHSCDIVQVKRTHASLSDQLLRIMRALDALEGQFAVASHQHNSKTYQIHEALSKDLSHLEAGLAPNSAGQHQLDSCSSSHAGAAGSTLWCTVHVHQG